MDRRKHKYTGGINDFCLCIEPYQLSEYDKECTKCGLRIKIKKNLGKVDEKYFDFNNIPDNYLF